MITCSQCGKHNATIYFKGIVNDQTIKMHLCEACAKKKGMVFPFAKFTQSLGDMVSSLASSSALGSTLLALSCRACGLSYSEFRQTSQLGCSQCYATFAPLIGPLLRKIQGSATHTGKTYRRTVRTASVVQELTRLKTELREAIRTENFEEAAKLRDQIQIIEKSTPEPTEKQG